MQRVVRFALVALVVLLALPVANVGATPRLTVGFFDDPSFRWARPTPTRTSSLAQKANASVIHVLADWSQIAPTKPREPARTATTPRTSSPTSTRSSRTAPRYDLQVMITISGTPKWANGGKTPNHPADEPQRPDAVRAHARGALQRPARRLRLRVALLGLERAEPRAVPDAAVRRRRRSSARRPTRSSTWPPTRASRPGNPLASSRPARPRTAAATSRPTSSGTRRARRRSRGCSSRRNPKLPFDAWATHPYPTVPFLGPTRRSPTRT